MLNFFANKELTKIGTHFLPLLLKVSNLIYLKKLFLILGLILPFTILSQGGFTIKNYHIDVLIDDSGSMSMTETIDLQFDQRRRGIIREIPTNGKFKNHRQNINISDVYVEGWNFTTTPGKNYTIKIGDKNTFITGDQQYIIKYKAHNGILNFENHEEIYWTLIGGDWNADILNGSFKITLPSEIELSEDDFHVFSGQVGESTEYGNIQKAGNVFTGKSLVTLGNNKALSVGIRLPKGYFFNQAKENITTIKAPKVYTKDRTYPFPILMILGFLTSFFVWGRNKTSNIMQERYYPPHNMSSAEVGTYYDFTVHSRDLLSLIPYWGEKGFIKVRVDDSSKKTDIYLEKQKDLPPETAQHEQYFFDHIFAYSDVVYIDEIKEEFYQDYTTSRKLLKEEILEKELYDAEAVRAFHSTKSIFLALICLALGVISIFVFNWVATGIGFFALSLLLFTFKFVRPKRSSKGQLLHDQLEEFKNTVKNPDQDKLQEIVAKDPRYFDKIFPYAVAFGLDKSWLKSFEDIGRKPDWYYYNDHRDFAYYDFQNDFNLKKIQNKMIIPPKASSDNSSFGGSGGGFSGGGFGGGGGSSW